MRELVIKAARRRVAQARSRHLSRTLAVRGSSLGGHSGGRAVMVVLWPATEAKKGTHESPPRRCQWHGSKPTGVSR